VFDFALFALGMLACAAALSMPVLLGGGILVALL
jgi:hypothetical protein